MAATLTTVAFVPQAIHIIRFKETRAISLQMYVVFATGVAFWLAFGLMIWNWPMMIANAITLALGAVDHRHEAALRVRLTRSARAIRPR